VKTVLQSVTTWLQNIFQESKQNNEKTTIAVLDGVRALAILFVISLHINTLPGNELWDWHTEPLAASIANAGAAGVTLFFVLSGLLLFMPYAKSLLFDNRWPLARTFYLRRALRIIPGYYLSLFVLILLTQPSYLQPAHWFNLGLFLTFLMDSSAQTFRQLNGPYWTLAVEWQFYMVLPLLALGILALVGRVRLHNRLFAVTVALCGLIAGALVLRFAGFYFVQNTTATILVPRSVLNVALFFLFGQIGKFTEDFAVGMLISVCYIYAQKQSVDHPFVQGLRRFSFWLWGVGILVLVFSAMWHFNTTEPAWPFLNPLMPYYNGLGEIVLSLGYGMCILAILFGPAGLWRPFAWQPLRWIGLISYSLYIWHLPLLLYFYQNILPLFSGLNSFWAYTFHWLWLVVVITPFCLLYYISIEKPGIRLGNYWRKLIEARASQRVQVQAAVAGESGESVPAAAFPQENALRS
jgi:peptidoglycan/LPS O-acetylase OafA/YrhL